MGEDTAEKSSRIKLVSSPTYDVNPKLEEMVAVLPKEVVSGDQQLLAFGHQVNTRDVVRIMPEQGNLRKDQITPPKGAVNIRELDGSVQFDYQDNTYRISFKPGYDLGP